MNMIDNSINSRM